MQQVSVVLLVMFALGCGAEPSPVDQCDDLVDLICDRAVVCLPMAGTKASCVQMVNQVISCGAAKQVSASYDRCMSQLNTTSCSVLFPASPQTGNGELRLPADCMAVILSRTVAPSGPFDAVRGLGVVR